MATKVNALQYAQDAANREQKEYLIQQQRNGQWLFSPATSPTNIRNDRTIQVVHPNANNR